MISVDTIIAYAIRDHTVMDQMGEALRSDLCIAHPFLRQIATFADEFLLRFRKLPATGDWELWLNSLQEGMQRDGCRETLGRLWAQDLSQYEPTYFGEQIVGELRAAAARTALSRLNNLSELKPEALISLSDEIRNISVGSIAGLANLRDVDTWLHSLQHEHLSPTGFPTFDRMIGGFGQELWLVFADSGMGKSMLLQNFLVNQARKGKRCLYITLELGLRSLIQRFYRQIAQLPRSQFVVEEAEARKRLTHWFKFATGEVHLIEFPAYSKNANDLARVIERIARLEGDIDLVGLDYLDLMLPNTGSKRGGDYADLGRVTHETRSWCSGFGMTVLSASQAVRRPEKAGRLSVRDMGDSYHKVRGADGLLSLVQTDDEEEQHQGRMGVLKVRDSGGRGQEVGLYINRDLAYIQELDHPNTVELMRRLGHLPGGSPPTQTVLQQVNGTQENT